MSKVKNKQKVNMGTKRTDYSSKQHKEEKNNVK